MTQFQGVVHESQVPLAPVFGTTATTNPPRDINED
jgi:hypothetical protein